MDYKTQYSETELNELAQWFTDHLSELPKSFQLDDATRIPDLHATARTIIGILEKPNPNIAFSGQIHIFFRLRDKLVAELQSQS